MNAKQLALAVLVREVTSPPRNPEARKLAVADLRARGGEGKADVVPLPPSPDGRWARAGHISELANENRERDLWKLAFPHLDESQDRVLSRVRSDTGVKLPLPTSAPVRPRKDVSRYIAGERRVYDSRLGCWRLPVL